VRKGVEVEDLTTGSVVTEPFTAQARRVYAYSAAVAASAG